MKKYPNLFHSIIANLDLYVCILGLFMGIFISFLSYYIHLGQTDIGIVVILACLSYILLYKRTYSFTEFSLSSISTRTNFTISILFILFFLCSLFILRTNLYHRPLIYFLLISIMSSIIFIQISYCGGEYNVNKIYIILCIMVISLNIKYSIFFEFSEIIGTDIQAHLQMSQLILKEGFITPAAMLGSKYTVYPIFQLALSIISLVIPLGSKSTLFVIILFFTINTIFIYLAFRSILGEKLGLIALLMANTSDLFIVTSVTSINPATIVFSWLLIIIYFVLKKSSVMSEERLIMILLICVMILSHQLSTVASFILILGLFLGNTIYNIFIKKITSNLSRDYFVLNNHMILFFLVTLQGYWMFSQIRNNVTFFDFVLGPVSNVLERGLFSRDISTNPYTEFFKELSIQSNALFHMGYLILLFFSIIGICIWSNNKHINNKKFALISSIVMLMVFVYITPLSSFGNSALTTRWLVFAYCLLIIPAVQGVFCLAACIRGERAKAIYLFVVINLFVFFMITTPYVNGDSPIYAKDRWPRAALKDSEISAAEIIDDTFHAPISTDYSYLRLYEFKTENSSISPEIYIKPGNIILIRKCLSNEAVAFKMIKQEIGMIGILGINFTKTFSTKRYNLIFDNGEVEAFTVCV